MSTHQNYAYGNLGFTLTLEQRQELEQLLVEMRAQYEVTATQSGLAQPLYDKLLSFMPPPGQGDDPAAYTTEYLKVYTWIDGARDVNGGEGVFATYIHNYTANQHRLRFGEASDVTGQVNEASNAIGLTLVDRILRNDGLLPSIEGIGAVDAGESARLVFENAQHYPGGDYTGWAGTLLFPFLGYDRFFEEWLLDENAVTATIGVGNGEPLQRTIKHFEGSYDLFAALQAHQETVEQYSLWQQFQAWWPSTLDSDQSDLIQATHDYVTRVYALPGGHAFTAGDLLPFVSAATYLGSDLGVRVGSLKDDVIDDYWPTPDEHFIIHAGEGDDTIYVPPYADFGGSALIDGGTGHDKLIYAQSEVLHSLNITLEALSGSALYPWRYSIVRQETVDGEEKIVVPEGEMAFVYSVEHLEASSESDRLSVLHPIRSRSDILVDLAGQGDEGNTLDFSAYQPAGAVGTSEEQSGVQLGISEHGWLTMGLQKEHQGQSGIATLQVGGVRNLVGSEHADLLSYSGFTSGLHITLESNPDESMPGAWRYAIVQPISAAAEEQDQLFAYSIEGLLGSAASDWLSMTQSVQFDTDLKIDFGEQGVYGNTVDFSNYQAGITLSMNQDRTIVWEQEQEQEQEPVIGSLSLLGVGNIVGTMFDDVLVGNAFDNIIDAGDGQNALWGGGGADTFIVGQGSNTLMDVDADDRLVIRLPMADSGSMFVLGGGVMLKAQVAGATGQPIALSDGQTAYLHPVQPNPMNYSPGLSGVWPLLDESMGAEFIIRYSLWGSDLNISASFLLDDGQTSFAEINVVDYQQGDLGLSFSELIVPNYTNAASNQKPMDVIISEFEQAHAELLQDWEVPPGFADVWYAA